MQSNIRSMLVCDLVKRKCYGFSLAMCKNFGRNGKF
jgi:hypothetical protein